MTLLPDLFDFAYIPNWHEQLNELAALALPEPWRFKNPSYQGKNLEHPILERYIQSVFRDRKSTRLNSSHSGQSRMPSSA